MPPIPINPGGASFTTTKNEVAAPGPPSAIRPLVIIGYCAGLATFTATPYSSPGAMQLACGTGSLVGAADYALSPNGGVQLVHVINHGGPTAATYGTITQSITGSAPAIVEADGTVLPTRTLVPTIEFTTTFVAGVAGGFYRYTFDGIRYSSEYALDTATSLTLPFGGGKYNILPPLAARVARLANIRTKFLAHAAGTGTYHGTADLESYTIPTPIDAATVLTCSAALLTSARAHVLKVTGSPAIHGIADATASTALLALVAPATQAQAWVFMEAIAVILFGSGTANSGHTIRTTGTVHGAADATNILTIAAATGGDVTADDSFTLQTNGPAPDSGSLTTAIRKLRDYTGDFGALLIADPLTGGLAEVVSTEIKALWPFGKFRDCVIPFRLPAAGETAAQYKAAIAAEYADVDSTEIRLVAGGCMLQQVLMQLSEGYAEPLSLPAWWVAATRARNQPEKYLSFAQAPKGVKLRDSSGNLYTRCFDEQDGEYYSVENRCIGMRSKPARAGVYCTQDLLLYGAESPWALGPYTSVVNFAVETVQDFLSKSSEEGYASPPDEPLADEIRKELEANANAYLDSEVVKKGRATECVIVLDANAGLEGVLGWTMTMVPLTYPINGVRLTLTISLVGGISAKIGG